jgi:hypothetical protein
MKGVSVIFTAFSVQVSKGFAREIIDSIGQFQHSLYEIYRSLWVFKGAQA